MVATKTEEALIIPPFQIQSAKVNNFCRIFCKHMLSAKWNDVNIQFTVKCNLRNKTKLISLSLVQELELFHLISTRSANKGV